MPGAGAYPVPRAVIALPAGPSVPLHVGRQIWVLQ